MELSRLCPHTQRPLPVNFRRPPRLHLRPSSCYRCFFAICSRSRLYPPLRFAVAKVRPRCSSAACLHLLPQPCACGFCGTGLNLARRATWNRVRFPTPASPLPAAAYKSPVAHFSSPTDSAHLSLTIPANRHRTRLCTIHPAESLNKNFPTATRTAPIQQPPPW